MTKALYRKYRSKSLGDILGQEHVTNVLSKSLAKGMVAHAYLLTGPRGVGKTSIARILAHEINQLPYDDTSNHLDIIEIDAASNNGVEDVRELRSKVQVTPVAAKRKVYIIDEVHMLSKAAFNALLKTLEEPPEHVVFILATTDIEKLPATIISRTQRFSLRAISSENATKHLAHIAKEENIAITPDALELIALRGDGSFRDSISLLDQLRSLAGENDTITRQLVEESLGLAPNSEVQKLLNAYEDKDLAALVELLDANISAGVQATVLTQQLLDEVRSQLVKKPQLLPLLDNLLEVARSSKPEVKLLTVLATASVKPAIKHAALSTAATSISAPVKELQKVSPSPPSTPPSQKYASSESDSPTPQVVGQGDKQREGDVSRLDWPKLVEYIREHYVAIYSVLSKCSYEVSEGGLTIYTGNAFYKKKLDDTKYRVNLTKSLIELGVGDITIDTIPTPPPPKDSLAASVAAIMGGGEEVSVGEEVTAS